MQNLSRHHIKYVLGIDIPLNESYQLNESQYKQIIEAQLLYENFLNTIKDFAKDKINNVITTVKTFKDNAVILYKILNDKKNIDLFSSNLWLKFGQSDVFKTLSSYLKKLGFLDSFNKLVQKISSLRGWPKFVAASAIATAAKFLHDSIGKLGEKTIEDFIKNYLSDQALSKITTTILSGGFDQLVSWFNTAKIGAETFYNTLAPIVKKFSEYIKENKDNKLPIDQIKKGVKAEMEHTKKIKDKKAATRIALKIALDHIKEDPKYYDKLKKAGLEEDEMIRCKNCAHDWKASEGGKDPYICHKCEENNTPIQSLNEGEFCPQCLAQYIKDNINSLQEAEYQGRKVQLGVPMAGDIKKFKVYVKNAKGNVVKVNFGQKGVKIKKNNPARRKSFRARHHCDTNPGPKWKARYWSCRKW